MLEPQTRQLLLNSLRPPDDYVLDFAIGTTFSLDLLALLSVPLAFTFTDWEDNEGQPTDDNLALLESIKRHANRICIFCQAGQIHVPKKDQKLFSYLERSVFEVKAKKKYGVFHPKIWLLRFTGKNNSAVSYRFLCLSRNLTYDRSWNTALIMDGTLQDRQNAFKINHPLGDFIVSLPELAESTGHSVPEDVRTQIGIMEKEVRKVQFELPTTLDERSRPLAFEEYRFWPLGLNSRSDWPFDGPNNEMANRRMLIISPFLNNTFLERITKKRNSCILISRADEITQIPKNTRELFGSLYTLSSGVLTDDLDAVLDGQNILSGLHAKLFLMDDGYNTRLWTGSANATSAAFPDPKKREDRDKGNIEFLVELKGPKAKFGIDKLLIKEKGSTSFADLLEEFYSTDEVSEIDTEQTAIKNELEDLRHLIAYSAIRAVVKVEEDAKCYRIQLMRNESLIASKDIKVRCWPVTLDERFALCSSLAAGVLATFNRISIDEITAFFAFELTLERNGRKANSRFAVKVNLEDVPEGRFAFLVRSLLKNKNQVLRMFLMLLSDQNTPSINGGEEYFLHGATENSADVYHEIPLLETMLRALERDPEKIDRINALVTDLMATNEGLALLPEGFNDIWPAIREAREALK